MTDSRLMLLDTAYLYFRAFHGFPDTLRSPDGRPVNAVRGILDFISRLIADHHPTHLACCWDDNWRPQWRVDLLASYKTHRVLTTEGATAVEEAPDDLNAQVPMIRKVLDAVGLPIVGVADHEADDVMGSLATSASSQMPVDVVTGDRDLFQLVSDEQGVTVVFVGRGVGKAERVDEAWLRDKYAIPASAYVDFAVLRGDPSDGIPGVAGIGEKTAAKLLAEHGSLMDVLAAASRSDGGVSARIAAKLHDAIDYLAVAGDVVRVVRDLPVPHPDALVLPRQPVNEAAFAQLTEELGLGSSALRIRTALSEAYAHGVQ